MKNLQFKEEDLNILASTRGKKLKSYEGEMHSKDFYFMNPIKLNMSGFSVQLELSFVPLTWTSPLKTQEMEDATTFICKNVDSSQKPSGKHVRVFPVEETISGITVIRDYLGTNMGDSFVFDNGIILSTGSSSISFVRYSIWDCAVYLKNKQEAELFYSVTRARNDFAKIADIGGLKINVKRELLIL